MNTAAGPTFALVAGVAVKRTTESRRRRDQTGMERRGRGQGNSVGTGNARDADGGMCMLGGRVSIGRLQLSIRLRLGVTCDLAVLV